MPSPSRNRVVAFLAALLRAGTVLVLLSRRAPALSEREFATQLLAERVKSAFKPKAVLVIGNPFVDAPNRSAQLYEFENASVRGVKSALGRDTSVKVRHPKVRPEVLANPGSVQIDPRSPTPLSFLVESSAFDELVKENSDCDVVISLIGLPINLGSMEGWSKPGLPRFALLLPDWRMIGNAEAIQSAFSSGKLAAAVVRRVNVTEGSDFKERYVIVDGENFGQLWREAPKMFGF